MISYKISFCICLFCALCVHTEYCNCRVLVCVQVPLLSGYESTILLHMAVDKIDQRFLKLSVKDMCNHASLLTRFLNN